MIRRINPSNRKGMLKLSSQQGLSESYTPLTQILIVCKRFKIRGRENKIFKEILKIDQMEAKVTITSLNHQSN